MSNKKKIKVVHVVEDLNVGGLERVISAIARGLNRETFVIEVWCLCRGGVIYDELKNSGIKVEILGMGSSRDLRFYFAVAKKLKQENVEIVHTHGCTANTVGRVCAFLARVPAIFMHLHTTPLNQSLKQKIIDALLIKYTDKIVCCSSAVLDIVSRMYDPKYLDKFKVVYNGVDEDLFVRQYEANKIERKSLRVGCVASFYSHKGHKYLIEAASIVKKTFKEPVEFVLVGKGELLDDLKQQAKKLAVDDIVIFHDVVSDIGQLLSWFDLVVLPSSEREGLGIALIEGMAAVKPVIGTDLGGIPELIENGVNGYLVPPRDAKALADAIIDILKNKELSEEMGKWGRKFVVEKFSNKIMLSRIEQIYLSTLESKRDFRK